MQNLKKLIWTILFAKQKLRHRCREEVYGHQVGKGVG